MDVLAAKIPLDVAAEIQRFQTELSLHFVLPAVPTKQQPVLFMADSEFRDDGLCHSSIRREGRTRLVRVLISLMQKGGLYNTTDSGEEEVRRSLQSLQEFIRELSLRLHRKGADRVVVNRLQSCLRTLKHTVERALDIGTKVTLLRALSNATHHVFGCARLREKHAPFACMWCEKKKKKNALE